VDGTNARMILLPDGTYLLGSREELLYAEGDLIGNPSQGIVAALKPVVSRLTPVSDEIRVFYVELYGGKVGAAAKQYTSDSGRYGWRLFDVLSMPDYAECLDWPAERIAAWRPGSRTTHAQAAESPVIACNASSRSSVTRINFDRSPYGDWLSNGRSRASTGRAAQCAAPRKTNGPDGPSVR
jgi:hypothetical protein